MKKLFTLAFAMVIAIGCLAADNVTAVFSVTPGMSCQNCENKIKSNLRFEKGVKDITTSLSDQAVTITYDPAKTSETKLIGAFKKIGYTATTAKGATQCTNNKKCDGNKACCKKQHNTKSNCKQTGEKKAGCCN